MKEEIQNQTLFPNDHVKCNHQNHKNKCYGENIYCKVDNQKRLDLLKLVKQEGKSLKDAAKSLNINYSTAKTILRVFRIENRILKKTPYQKRSRKTQKNKELNFCNENNSHDSESNKIYSQHSFNIESEKLTLNNLNLAASESCNNLNILATQVNSSNNLLKENFLCFPETLNANSDKNSKDNRILMDSIIYPASFHNQNQSSSLNINALIDKNSKANCPSYKIPYKAQLIPKSNNHLKNFGDNLAKNNNFYNYLKNQGELKISDNSNFISVPHNSYINTSMNLINNSVNNDAGSSCNMTDVVKNFLDCSKLYENTYLNNFSEFYKISEEFMEKVYYLINMLKNCIGEVTNNDYIIKSLACYIQSLELDSRIGNRNNFNSYDDKIYDNFYDNKMNKENLSECLKNKNNK